MSLDSMKNSEYLYQRQKGIIKDILSKKVKPYSSIQEKGMERKKITFNAKESEWEYSIFGTINSKDTLWTEIPTIQNEKWSPFENKTPGGIEIRNLIFQSKALINYTYIEAMIKAKVTLKGQSTFWIFLHSNEKFSKNTAVISFTKEEYSDTVFLALGVFIEGENKELVYRPFLQRQLILGKPSNFSEDIVNLSITIKDTGSERIEGKVYINDSKEDNHFSYEFFIPVDMNMQEYKVMIAGSGEKCQVSNFSCDCGVKSETQSSESNQPPECKII